MGEELVYEEVRSADARRVRVVWTASHARVRSQTYPHVVVVEARASGEG